MQSFKKLARDCYAVIDNATGKIIAVGSTLALATSNALAAVPVEVTTAITDATADGKTIGFALLGFAVAVGVIFYLKRRAG